MNDRIKYWLDLSDYDIETANAMLKSKRFLYVGFMCHQTIEKVFKAYFSKLNSEIAPHSQVCHILQRRVVFTTSLMKIRKTLLIR